MNVNTEQLRGVDRKRERERERERESCAAYTFSVDEYCVDGRLDPAVTELTGVIKDRVGLTAVEPSVDQQGTDAAAVHVIREANTHRTYVA